MKTMKTVHIQQPTTECTGQMDSNTSALSQLTISGHYRFMYTREMFPLRFFKWLLLGCILMAEENCFIGICQPNFLSQNRYQRGLKVGMSLQASFYV